MWKVYELQTAFYTGTEHAEDTVHCHRRRKSWFPNPMKYFAKQDWILRTGTFTECLMERERERDLTLVFCSRETWLKFTISGYFNLTSYMVAASDVPLQDVVLGVWCAICATRIIGPVFFFCQTINSHRYVIICHHLSYGDMIFN
jgi:hypothetical protein